MLPSAWCLEWGREDDVWHEAQAMPGMTWHMTTSPSPHLIKSLIIKQVHGSLTSEVICPGLFSPARSFVFGLAEFVLLLPLLITHTVRVHLTYTRVRQRDVRVDCRIKMLLKYGGILNGHKLIYEVPVMLIAGRTWGMKKLKFGGWINE
jgi:hypothetical protein